MIHTMVRRALSMDEAIARAKHLVHKYARNCPYGLVKDQVVLRNIVAGLARNWVQHGLPYCPCKEVTGDRDRDREIVCPCKEHHKEIEETGSCCCGLYLKGE